MLLQTDQSPSLIIWRLNTFFRFLRRKLLRCSRNWRIIAFSIEDKQCLWCLRVTEASHRVVVPLLMFHQMIDLTQHLFQIFTSLYSDAERRTRYQNGLEWRRVSPWRVWASHNKPAERFDQFQTAQWARSQFRSTNPHTLNPPHGR